MRENIDVPGPRATAKVYKHNCFILVLSWDSPGSSTVFQPSVVASDTFVHTDRSCLGLSLQRNLDTLQSKANDQMKRRGAQ